MLIRQLFDKESSTYTYLLGDFETNEAIIIDPVDTQIDRDLKLIGELGLSLKYVLETHVHADHITSSGRLKDKTGAKIALGAANKEVQGADVFLEDEDEIKFGSYTLKAISTPGHTAGCTCYVVDDKVFTGDVLFIRGCGRTDFQGGSSAKLFHSVHEKLFELPDGTLVYPGHDYKGMMVSSIGEEKSFNPRLKKGTTVEKFKAIMDNLKLAHPKKMEVAVPANLKCGRI